jgi:hypothetical protein
VGSTLEGDTFVRGALSAKTLAIPPGTITDAAVSASAGIAATKVVHQFPARVSQASGSAVVTRTELVHVVRGATGAVTGFEVACAVVPTSTDTVVVDLQKSTGGGAFASVLSSTITLNSASTVRTAYAATISAASLVDGDVLQVVVTATGASCQGLAAVATLRETPD